jgi:hypothetical protein
MLYPWPGVVFAHHAWPFYPDQSRHRALRVHGHHTPETFAVVADLCGGSHLSLLP